MTVDICLATNFMISPGYLPISCCYKQTRICMRDIHREMIDYSDIHAAGRNHKAAESI